jgi:beta-N-acetylhexosaminidase
MDLVGRALVLGVRGSSMDDERTRGDVEAMKRARVKGVVLFDRELSGAGGARNVIDPGQVARLVSDLKHELGAGTVVAIDQEGGAVRRLRREDGFVETPSARELGAMGESDVRAAARAQGAQLAALGIGWNFAPVVDCADGGSPGIGDRGRSFGLDPARVAERAMWWIEEHERAGVRSCLKHYPGLGAARVDTHVGMADVTGTDREVERGVFREVVGARSGAAVMVAHVMDRGVDGELPASLSGAHVRGGLRGGLGFDGVVVTDSVDMGAITARWGAGDACVLALRAGVDLVLDGVNGPGGWREHPAGAMADAAMRALRDGVLDEGGLAASGARVARFFGG